MKKVLTIFGTRPEITKLSPLIPLLDDRFSHVLAHTGQHYDHNMDRLFFEELDLRSPDHQLHVGSGSPVAQLGKMLERLDSVFERERPDIALVLGDTNSALAGALAGVKWGASVAHVESGCRSFNRSTPEEQNRILIDHISTFLFAPDETARANLENEGLKANTTLVGSTALDATKRLLPLAKSDRLQRFDLQPNQYVIATIHRAENVDNEKTLSNLIDALNNLSNEVPVVFPVHPRTEKAIANHTLSNKINRLPPIGNLDFIALIQNSLFVLSDSGGVQEECAVVNRPCIVLRNETEWTRLIEAKKNFLSGTDPEKILSQAKTLLDPAVRSEVEKRPAPLDYGAADRIAAIIEMSPSPCLSR